ncbi:MAG TPA: ABC-F family ATP-binding cassette domain-containing protein [Ktedonobacteraceae bacterium]|nr:ABC-F family ATP-binding cassette domain-containing protein [Ktedonobacteraceae bacterium]
MLFVRNLYKSYGVMPVLENISFVINQAERVGIVGSNGVGKTTLFRILTGSEQADSGTVTLAPSLRLGYLPQSAPDFYGRTIQDLISASLGNLRELEERMHALEVAMAEPAVDNLGQLIDEYGRVSTTFQDKGGYDLERRLDIVLSGLGLAYLPREREVETLSGGEKARVGLAALLLSSPDFLLLDEPTNHLDSVTLEWLESYLADYSGAIVMISHDRQFLNRTVTQIFEIDEFSHELKQYAGNYDAYVQAREAERRKWEEEYERQQEEIADLRKRIRETARQVAHNRPPRDSFKMTYDQHGAFVQQAISRGVRAAEEQLRRIEVAPVPKPPKRLQVSSSLSTEPLKAEQAIKVQGLSKSWGERSVLNDLNFVMSARTRILLRGPNGAGKTTLLNILAGRVQPDCGAIQVVDGVKAGYLHQDPELDPQKTVIETYRYNQVGFEDEFVGRLIGYGLFRREDMEKKAGYLSLGQQRKLEIACLMAARPNLLLLDEPTNYISLDMLEAFEKAVLDFEGPVLAVSHDRWFIERFKGQIWTLVDGKLKNESATS